VVWGANKADLKFLAPRGSFIHADDFANPQDLVSLINTLDKDDEAYAEYFKWRRSLPQKLNFRKIDVEKSSNHIFEGMKSYGYCDLCRKLHSNRLEFSHSIASLEEWWHGSERESCS